MDMVRLLGETLQRVLGPALDELGRESGVIRRQRKFSGSTLLKTLLLTVMRIPNATPNDYAATAGQLGVFLTPEAVERRFTPRLVIFLRMALERIVGEVVASKSVKLKLLQKFSSIRIGDSTTISLPDQYADEFPGCGGSGGSGKSALKIQVLWNLATGQLLRLILESGRSGDSKSSLLDEPAPAGSLSIFDLGYFLIKRFRQWGEAGAFWISRLQPATLVFHPDGQPLNVLKFLRKQYSNGTPIDMAILLSGVERLACRMLALRVPQEEASRRRQKAYRKAQKHGREPSQELLDMCDWNIFVTNCSPELLTWKEVIVLYRARWQIELLFKLWKSHSGLDKHKTAKSADWQMAELLVKLIGVLIQHWLLVTATWLNPRRSLFKAAQVLRNWIGLLFDALNDLDRFSQTLGRLSAGIDTFAHVEPRRKHPSSFQLLEDPELLEYAA